MMSRSSTSSSSSSSSSSGEKKPSLPRGRLDGFKHRATLQSDSEVPQRLLESPAALCSGVVGAHAALWRETQLVSLVCTSHITSKPKHIMHGWEVEHDGKRCDWVQYCECVTREQQQLIDKVYSKHSVGEIYIFEVTVYVFYGAALLFCRFVTFLTMCLNSVVLSSSLRRAARTTNALREECLFGIISDVSDCVGLGSKCCISVLWVTSTSVSAHQPQKL